MEEEKILIRKIIFNNYYIKAPLKTPRLYEAMKMGSNDERECVCCYLCVRQYF